MLSFLLTFSTALKARIPPTNAARRARHSSGRVAPFQALSPSAARRSRIGTTIKRPNPTSRRQTIAERRPMEEQLQAEPHEAARRRISARARPPIWWPNRVTVTAVTTVISRFSLRTREARESTAYLRPSFDLPRCTLKMKPPTHYGISVKLI